jgi:hypothetical protein
MLLKMQRKYIKRKKKEKEKEKKKKNEGPYGPSIEAGATHLRPTCSVLPVLGHIKRKEEGPRGPS